MKNSNIKTTETIQLARPARLCETELDKRVEDARRYLLRSQGEATHLRHSAASYFRDAGQHFLFYLEVLAYRAKDRAACFAYACHLHRVSSRIFQFRFPWGSE
jgi:hypothetical protein